MDTSFTFVTALTPATGKIKGAPKFSKLSDEKLKASRLKTTKNTADTCKPSTSNALPIRSRLALDSSTSSCSQKTYNDSFPSLKSRSESLHLSSDRSLSDSGDDKKAPFDQSRKSDNQTTFKKIIQEVHAGLERITFRKKKPQKCDEKAGTNSFNNCLQQLTSIRKGDSAKVKSSTPTDDCDIMSDISDLKSPSAEELDKLQDKMLDLSLEKPKTSRTSKPKSKNIHKKLFNSILDTGDKSRSIQIVEKAVDPPSTVSKNLPFNSDSSGIISEDISPILRLSVAPLTNVYLDTDDYPSPTNYMEIKETKAADNIPILDKFQSKEITKKDTKPTNKTKPKDNKKKARKVLSEWNDIEEKSPESEKIKEKPKENAVRPRVRKPKKKKDSFIASDNSSVENESMSVYHKFISENIKFDVIKTTTPRSKFKNNADFHDDGIFTPFIIGKRSSSEDSFSEIENQSETQNRIKKFRLSSSDDDDVAPSIRKSLLSSLSSLSDTEKKSSDLELSPKQNDKPKKAQPKKKLRSKKVAQLNLSSDSSKSSTESKNDLCIDLTSSPSFTPGSSSKEKKKITPITFKLKNLKKLTPARTPNMEKEPLSFLRSLSTHASPHMIHPEAEQYRKSFKKLKDQLAQKLFVLFNKEVFDKKLPDDLKIEWNPRMRSSSGLCYNRRVKTIIGPNNECLRISRIALSTKIIETPERLRDTLIHELCHAAAWIIDNKADGHGPCWKSWALKAQRRFPELPPIKRCHDYSIQTKFKYRCVNCGYTIGRHSKSLNLERKRCGYCYGRFELLLNHEHVKPSNSITSPKNVKARPLSKFALFVKDNYGKVKSENTTMKHGDIMKVLSKNFADTKI